MGDSLSFDNILGEQDINSLFIDQEEQVVEEKGGQDPETKPGEETNNSNNNTTEVVNPEDLFAVEQEDGEEKKPESVGSGETEEEKEDTSTDTGGGASPENFYSSIASALAEEGIFPNLDDETIKKAEDPETFNELIEAEVNARLEDKQRKISQALENGVEPSDIRMYEGALKNLSQITEEIINKEGDEGERVRRALIYQDLINKGYSQERAEKMTARSFDSGNDIEDAKEAFESNKTFYQENYDKLLKEAQKKADKEKADRQKQSEKLKNSLLTDKQVFGDMEISKEIRQKAFDNLMRPTYKDPDTGEYMTAIQKYEVEHRAEFLRNVGLFFTLTNGFKDFESFTKGKVKKEVKKGLRELEDRLSGTKRTNEGNLKLVTGVQEDPESFWKGMKLAL